MTIPINTWTKSVRSYETGACVEVCAQDAPSHTHHTSLCLSIRDTEHRSLTRLDFPALSYASLLGAIK